MKRVNKVILIIIAVWASSTYATPINDFQFKSPSLNGSNYGTFQLALENEQYQRQQAVQQAIQAAAQQAASAAANTPLQQFLTNLESRIYAQISQNVATSMFSTPGQVQPGSIAFGAGNITWSQTILPGGVSGIQLQVFDGMNTTTVNVPMGQFTPGGGGQ
jgi:Type VIII secretion system (T8SS), CsgF protein